MKKRTPEPRRAAKKVAEIRTVEDLTLDPRNPNKHTKQGTEMLRRSVKRFGAARPVLAAADGTVLAGNATVEEWKRKGGKIRVVRTSGHELVVAQRTDLHSEDPRAQQLKIADNRVAEVNLDYDEAVLAEARAIGATEGYFSEFELSLMTGDGPWKATSKEMAQAQEQAATVSAETSKWSKEQRAYFDKQKRDHKQAMAEKKDPYFYTQVVFPSWDALRAFQRALGLPAETTLPGPVFAESIKGLV